jgi:FkbM family methyltransferase
VLAIAAENLIRNRLSNRARFVTAFAGDQVGTAVKFWTIGTGAAGSMYPQHAVSASRARSWQQVPTTTVDALCDTFQCVPDLVKIDVEGAEHRVLLGSTQCATHAQTRFLVEMHSNPDLIMVDNASRVLAWCQQTGYRAWYLAEATCLEDPHQIAARGRCHLLLQPSTWEYPVWLSHIKQRAALTEALQGATDEQLV